MQDHYSCAGRLFRLVRTAFSKSAEHPHTLTTGCIQHCACMHLQCSRLQHKSFGRNSSKQICLHTALLDRNPGNLLGTTLCHTRTELKVYQLAWALGLHNTLDYTCKHAQGFWVVSRVISLGTHRAVVISGSMAASAMSSAFKDRSWLNTPCVRIGSNYCMVPKLPNGEPNLTKFESLGTVPH